MCTQVTFFRVDHRLLDHMKDGILHVEVWAEQSLEERSAKAAAISRRNQFSFTTPVSTRSLPLPPAPRAVPHLSLGPWCIVSGQDVGAVRRAYTEANMEAEIQGQKLTEVITKLKGDLKTVAEVRSASAPPRPSVPRRPSFASIHTISVAAAHAPQCNSLPCTPRCATAGGAQRNARLLRKMTEMQLLMTDASRKGLVSPQVLKEALELLKPGGKSKFIQAVRNGCTNAPFVWPRPRKAAPSSRPLVSAQAKLIGDAHASVAAQDGSFDGSRACSIM